VGETLERKEAALTDGLCVVPPTGFEPALPP
jgi:hypothetical protein